MKYGYAGISIKGQVNDGNLFESKSETLTAAGA